MAERDYEKYAYLTIALEKTGPTYQGLVKDAEEIGTKQLPTVAAMALKNYYAGMMSSRRALGEQITTPAHSHGHVSDVAVKNISTADANAAAALDEWV